MAVPPCTGVPTESMAQPRAPSHLRTGNGSERFGDKQVTLYAAVVEGGSGHPLILRTPRQESILETFTLSSQQYIIMPAASKSSLACTLETLHLDTPRERTLRWVVQTAAWADEPSPIITCYDTGRLAVVAARFSNLATDVPMDPEGALQRIPPTPAIRLRAHRFPHGQNSIFDIGQPHRRTSQPARGASWPHCPILVGNPAAAKVTPRGRCFPRIICTRLYRCRSHPDNFRQSLAKLVDVTRRR
ncbi:hypothetical protein QAD02_015861 [Eretmocerus hayati]|uniref:Uncharacterized protein n=1 Tax=Eretmocerus hayati TaxID=131215 RepID=A0ACC2PBV6_9HYME|nr:hypothetical protein QAD02_015861 [Eretmocerus hayati]